MLLVSTLLYGHPAQAAGTLRSTQQVSPTSKRPMIEIGPKPLTFERAANGSWGTDAHKKTEAWMRDDSHKIPWVKVSGETSDSVEASAGLSEDAQLGTLGRLIARILTFANDVSTDSNPLMHTDFRSIFTHPLYPGSENKLPDFAWVVEVIRSTYELHGQSALREGGVAGIQIPVAGHNLIARLMPVAGNFERFSIGDYPDGRIDTADTAIHVRPTAELDASFRKGMFKPGARLLVQPRVFEGGEIRMLAEVYLNFDFQVADPMLKSISVVPRCVLDMSNDSNAIAHTEPNQALLGAHLLADKMMSCSISAEFAFGR